ncbi:hypothetical protein [Pelagicoccus sp. SDUM812002]|uniref:hypothetical protein n=1 Tax=Pelagicoccus sp. SDUM812002 TaxID=3041266 RepID=UPI00280CCE6C|nr:hypothetical protein [Pelagicoccus sp. SDUM812002]MDQ8184850.1 hypothetical protein [Pelagicoccus sp. SDUM812002]
MSEAAIAARSSCLIKSGKGKAISGRGDLIELILSGELTLKTLDREQLTPEHRELPSEDFAALVYEYAAKRQQIEASLQASLSQRAAYIAEEMEKVSEADKEEIFELSAFQALEDQAVAAGYSF